MKKCFFIIVFFASVLYSQQSKFIIGADWLNTTYPDPYTNYAPLGTNYWNLIQSFGLNYGALNLGRYSWGTSNINTELNKAAQRGISTFLWTYQLYPTHGRRWMYQVEDNYDFGSHSSGLSRRNDPVNDVPAFHWSKIKLDETVSNYWELLEGRDTYGYIVENVLVDNLQPDGSTYWVKIGIRKTGIENSTQPVAKVIIINKTNNLPVEQTIYANQLTRNVWQEKFLFNFNKTAIGPSLSEQQINNYVLNDSSYITGIEDYLISDDPTVYTPYEIKIYWYGEVSCDFDYIVLDDAASDNLHNGSYDNIITSVTNDFLTNDGLGNIKIKDEGRSENFLAMRYVNTKINNILTGTGYENKYALAFHVPQWAPTQKYLAEAKMKTVLMDDYPIPYFNDDGITPFVIPGGTDYASIIQARFESHLTQWLNSTNLKAIQFETPFWFTPQAHSWIAPDQNWYWHREPSAYEIKTMTNLGICHGAKGIHYFMFSKPRNPSTGSSWGDALLEDNNRDNPLPRYTDAYGYPKWETVKQLNQKLAAIGDELLSLTWQNAFYINNGTQPSGIYIANVQSYYNPDTEAPIIPEDPATTYIQLGIFKKTDDPNNINLEHFFVVNRRTMSSEQRNIQITINKSQSDYTNWKVTEIGTGSTWTVNKTGSFETLYEPGEGKLFKLEPVMIVGGNILYSEIIHPGKTWNFAPGVTVKFAPGTSLIVNGTLNAIGTPSNKITFDRSGTTGTWGSITFDGSAASGSVLDNVNIKYASDVKCLNGANVTIQNSLIDHCTQGIYVYNSQPQILNNQIIEPVQNGIYCNALGKSPLILNNVITKTSSNPTFRNYQGIWLENHTNGYIAHNDVQGFYWGIYAGGGSSGNFTNYSFQNFNPNNRICNNSFGFAAGWGSSISAGYLMYYGMNNSICNNVSYDVYCYQSSSITAQYNYWGGGLPKQYKDGTSYLNVLYPLTSDPWGGGLAPNSQSIQNSDIYTSSSLVSPVNDDSTISEIYMAIDLELTGRIEEAIIVYKNMIDRNINTSISLTSLARIKTKFGRTDLFEYFLNLSNTNTMYKNTVLKILAGMFLQDNQYERALAIYDEIIVSNENNYEGISARFESFFAALDHKKDYKKASAFLSEISSLNLTDKELISRKEFAEYLFRSINDSSNVLNKNSNEILSKSEFELPKDYSLNQNYPNPFNPTTTIKYDLPVDGLVSLEIFDILGRRITTLVNEQRTAGSYEQIYNASSLASGVYVYKLQSGDFISSKKMILLK
jgi:tetratricopeptide (TPR) repeat protein